MFYFTAFQITGNACSGQRTRCWMSYISHPCTSVLSVYHTNLSIFFSMLETIRQVAHLNIWLPMLSAVISRETVNAFLRAFLHYWLCSEFLNCTVWESGSNWAFLNYWYSWSSLTFSPSVRTEWWYKGWISIWRLPLNHFQDPLMEFCFDIPLAKGTEMFRAFLILLSLARLSSVNQYYQHPAKSLNPIRV